MTVKKLIEKLQECDPNAQVIIHNTGWFATLETVKYDKDKDYGGWECEKVLMREDD